MWPNVQWWSALGFASKGDYLAKTLPNKWELCISTDSPAIPTKPPLDGEKLYIVAYEPDGNQTVVTFGMSRDSNINPETFLAALIERVEEQILA